MVSEKELSSCFSMAGLISHTGWTTLSVSVSRLARFYGLSASIHCVERSTDTVPDLFLK